MSANMLDNTILAGALLQEGEATGEANNSFVLNVESVNQIDQTASAAGGSQLTSEETDKLRVATPTVGGQPPDSEQTGISTDHRRYRPLTYSNIDEMIDNLIADLERLTGYSTHHDVSDNQFPIPIRYDGGTCWCIHSVLHWLQRRNDEMVVRTIGGLMRAIKTFEYDFTFDLALKKAREVLTPVPVNDDQRASKYSCIIIEMLRALSDEEIREDFLNWIAEEIVGTDEEDDEEESTA